MRWLPPAPSAVDEQRIQPARSIHHRTCTHRTRREEFYWIWPVAASSRGSGRLNEHATSTTRGLFEEAPTLYPYIHRHPDFRSFDSSRHNLGIPFLPSIPCAHGCPFIKIPFPFYWDSSGVMYTLKPISLNNSNLRHSHLDKCYIFFSTWNSDYITVYKSRY